MAPSRGPATRGGGGRLPSVRRAVSMAAASSPRVGASNRVRKGSRTPNTRATRAIIWTTRSECPPAAKKWSRAPAWSTSRTSLHKSARACSVKLRGSDVSPEDEASGARAGRARRSTLPPGVCGSAARMANADGTMNSGQDALQPAPQLERGGPPPGDRHDPGRQPLVAVGADHRGLDLGMPEEGRFDLCGLDAEAAHLELLVDAAEEFDAAVEPRAAEVAGAVHPRSGVGGERIGEESLRRQVRPAQIAARQAGPAEEELGHRSHRLRSQPRAQQVDPRIGDRAPDGNRGEAVLRRPRAGPGEGVDGGFGGAVEVVESGSMAGVKLRRQPGLQRLPAAEDGPQPRAAFDPVRLEQEAKLGGDDLQDGDLPLRHQLQQVGGIPLPAGTRQDQMSSGEQRREDLPHRGVEADRGLLQDAVAAAQRQLSLHPEQAIGDRPVGDQDSLRPARGARRVADVGEVVQGDRRRPGDRLRRRSVGIHDGDAPRGAAGRPAIPPRAGRPAGNPPAAGRGAPPDTPDRGAPRPRPLPAPRGVPPPSPPSARRRPPPGRRGRPPGRAAARPAGSPARAARRRSARAAHRSPPARPVSVPPAPRNAAQGSGRSPARHRSR